MGKQCLINSPRSGLFWVKWRENRLPDGVELGSRVTIFGQIITLDLGRAFMILNAVAISPTRMKEFKTFLKQS